MPDACAAARVPGTCREALPGARRTRLAAEEREHGVDRRRLRVPQTSQRIAIITSPASCPARAATAFSSGADRLARPCHRRHSAARSASAARDGVRRAAPPPAPARAAAPRRSSAPASAIADQRRRRDRAAARHRAGVGTLSQDRAPRARGYGTSRSPNSAGGIRFMCSWFTHVSFSGIEARGDGLMPGRSNHDTSSSREKISASPWAQPSRARKLIIASGR